MRRASWWKASGFTLIELMIVFAILAMAAGLSAPHVQKWMRSYRLKGAVMDLHANMQLAKASAVKGNRPWLLQFDASGTYTVIQCLTNTCTTGGTEDTDWREIKTVNLKATYGDEIIFYNPQSSLLFEQNPLTFQRDGTTTTAGFTYISNALHSSYYRVGTQFIAGAVRIQRWTGSQWN
jgi:prepilin-type N-terminal cleavage/methylation domain-containing protein